MEKNVENVGNVPNVPNAERWRVPTFPSSGVHVNSPETLWLKGLAPRVNFLGNSGIAKGLAYQRTPAQRRNVMWGYAGLGWAPLLGGT